jgi:gliding motility-associated-like protein
LEPAYENPLNDAEIDWTTGATSPNLTVTQSGTYCVTISNGCGSDEACVEVLIDPIPEVDVEPEYLLCDQTSFNLDPIATDDDSYIYTWSGDGLNSSEPTITINESGEYTITVSNDCGTDNVSFEVILEPTPVLNALEDEYVLCDEPSVTIDPIVNDDDSYTYTWSGPGFNSSNPTETIDANGSYTVTINNECGSVNASFDVTIVEALSVTVNNVNLCDEPSGTLVASANQPVSYSWDNGETGSSIEVSSAGEYCVTVANACETQEDCGTVQLNFSPDLSINPGSIENLCPGISVTVSANAGSASGVTWNWTLACSGAPSSVGNPSSSSLAISSDWATESCPDGFTVILNASNVCGTDAIEVPVTVDPCLLDLPNVFTPNGDDVNDVFFVNGLENYSAFGGVDLKVFNRWGNLVYEDSNYQNNWEGKDISGGTYYYILTLPNTDVHKSALTIITE